MTEDTCGEIKNDGEPCEYTPKCEDGKCGIHTEETDTDDGGRPSKFENVREDLIEAADGPLNLKQVANKGGISRSTLYEYLDEYEEFSDSFKRARASAAERLTQRALDPEDAIDISFARFLLERSFKFIKTERQELNATHEHAGEGGGPVEISISETVVETGHGDDT